MLTQEDDQTGDMVVHELHSRAVPVFRFDTADFPLSLTLNGHFDGVWHGALRGPDGSVALESIRSVYFRRPTGFVFPDDMTDAERQFAGREARRGIGGLLMSLPCLWLNHPSRVADAEYKPFQLAAAAGCGLDVPRTALTNDPTAAEDIRAHLGSEMVYKTLASASIVDGSQLSFVYTTPVMPDFVADERVALTVHQFQERVYKARDIRATVVGDQVFATNLYVDAPEGEPDWRTNYSAIRYEETRLPAPIESSLLALMRRLGLRFSAADFMVTPDDRYYFIDLNPNGEWGWIEKETRLPIAAAVATLLAEEKEWQAM
ncbi:MAG: ATP-grasp ribosomal peptide maturase [Pseudonocardiaceae bacterium]